MFSRKHVLIVMDWLDIGGAEKQALLLAQGLIGRGFKVTVMGFQTGVKVPEWCLENGIDCIFEPFTWSKTTKESLRHLWRLAKKLRSLRPDYLIPFTRSPNVVCGLLWRFTGAGGALWNQRDAGVGLTGGRLEKLALLLASRIVSNSQHALQMLIARYKLSQDHVQLIRNGVALPEDFLNKSEAKQRLDLPTSAWVVSMVANLHSQKDHPTVLKAWASVLPVLARAGMQGVLVFAGRDDGRRDALKELAIQLGLRSSDVRFFGYIRDSGLLMRASDVFVFGSHPRHEGCPNAILEAMVHGLPVAATDCDGVKEALPDHGVGQVVPNGDVGSLTELLCTYALNSEYANQFGVRNCKFVDHSFGLERMVEEYINIMAKSGVYAS
jgi:glycosyltransferase involved in cell wall biosynthesis